MAATDAVAAISLAEIGQRAVGVAQTAVQYFETATITTPLGALPVFVVGARVRRGRGGGG